MTSGFNSLSTEMVEKIISESMEGLSYDSDLKHLISLAQVCGTFWVAARRLTYREIEISTTDHGLKFSKAIFDSVRAHCQGTTLPPLGTLVRKMKIAKSALEEMDFSDVTVDDMIRFCPNLVSLDSPVGNFSPLPDGRIPFAFYPRTLDHFRYSWTSGEEEIFEEDVDSEDDEDDPAEQNKEVKNALILASIVRRLSSLPPSLGSLSMELLGHPLPTLPPAVIDRPEFPLKLLQSIELVNLNMSATFLDWMCRPSIESHSLKRIKFWSISNMASDYVKLLNVAGPQLQVLLFKYSTSADRLSQFLPSCTNLKSLTVGPGSFQPKTFFTSLTCTTLTYLCIHIPRHNPPSLRPIQTALTSGNLQNVRVLELYSQKYWPRPTNVTYCDDFASSSPKTQLRELRLSHIQEQDGDLRLLIYHVGDGLRTLALHRCGIQYSELLPHCPNLRRLELGFPGFHDCEVVHSIGARGLTFLRVHSTSITPAHLLKALEVGGQLEGVKIVDITGLRTHEISNEWTGKVINTLISIVPKFSINQRVIRSPGDVWMALKELD